MSEGWNRFASENVEGNHKNYTTGIPPRDFRLGWLQGKRDRQKEERMRAWIAQILGENQPTQVDFVSWLSDGTVLCKLMNKLSPGIISKINTKGQYGLRTNVGEFLRACQKFGLREEDCFTVNDLCENVNLAQVVSTLYTLAHTAHAKDNKINLP